MSEDATATVEKLRYREYELRNAQNRLQLELNEAADVDAMDALLEQMVAVQDELEQVNSALAQVTAAESKKSGARTRSARVGADVQLKMAHIPTAIYHLLDAESMPLVQVQLTARRKSGEARSASVTAYIEYYSAQAVATVDLSSSRIAPVALLPTLFAERVNEISEITRATVHVVVRDLGTGHKISHETYPVWLLSRNSAQMSVKDPSTGAWTDLSRYLGAFVTPNAPAVMHFQRKVAAHHPQGKLAGYDGDSVEAQVRAVFDALKADADIAYVNSVIDFNPEEGAKTQRIRRPSQSLSEGQANCVDGTVLMASLLEAISLNPAIVVIPKHVLIAWETGSRNDKWRYLETTQIGDSSFEEATAYGERLVGVYEKQFNATQNPAWFRRWSLRELRAEEQIWPME